MKMKQDDFIIRIELENHIKEAMETITKQQSLPPIVKEPEPVLIPPPPKPEPFRFPRHSQLFEKTLPLIKPISQPKYSKN